MKAKIQSLAHFHRDTNQVYLAALYENLERENKCLSHEAHLARTLLQQAIEEFPGAKTQSHLMSAEDTIELAGLVDIPLEKLKAKAAHQAEQHNDCINKLETVQKQILSLNGPAEVIRCKKLAVETVWARSLAISTLHEIEYILTNTDLSKIDKIAKCYATFFKSVPTGATLEFTYFRTIANEVQKTSSLISIIKTLTENEVSAAICAGLGEAAAARIYEQIKFNCHVRYQGLPKQKVLPLLHGISTTNNEMTAREYELVDTVLQSFLGFDIEQLFSSPSTQQILNYVDFVLPSINCQALIAMDWEIFQQLSETPEAETAMRRSLVLKLISNIQTQFPSL